MPVTSLRERRLVNFRATKAYRDELKKSKTGLDVFVKTVTPVVLPEVAKKVGQKRLAAHIEKTIGPQISDSPPTRPSPIDWKKIKGGKLVKHKGGNVWVPTLSTLEEELPKYPNMAPNGFGTYAPKEIYEQANNPDEYVESDADRPFTESESEAAATLNVNPRMLFKDHTLDNDDNQFRATVRPHMPDLLITAVALAKGYCVGSYDDDGEVKKLYSVPPDANYLKYLLDQFHGRAPQRASSVGDKSQDKLVLAVEDYA